MIGISFNKKEFEYDAYTLVKAFYPKEDIEMYGTWEKEGPKDYEKLVSISYGDQVVIGIHTREQTLEDSAPYDEEEDRKKRKNTCNPRAVVINYHSLKKGWSSARLCRTHERL